MDETCPDDTSGRSASSKGSHFSSELGIENWLGKCRKLCGVKLLPLFYDWKVVVFSLFHMRIYKLILLVEYLNPDAPHNMDDG